MQITDERIIDKYYIALVNKDPNFLGVFFVGVKTTSIFCISTCRARKPKKENVVFYTSINEALENGFRPCKICRPTENAAKTPKAIEKALSLIKSYPKEKITDHRLKLEGISPDRVRRWFKKHYGLTFHAYQRMFRINTAYEELLKGKSTTETAFSSGYDSLSGFGYTFKKLTGLAPSKMTIESTILISRLTTPIGPMFVCATKVGICLLEFTNRKMLETEFQDLQKRLKSPILTGENKHIIQLQKELAEYFNGNRQTFDVALDPQGTDFQKTVWEELMNIQYGTTTTYLKQATALNKTKGVRSVAKANGYNKISIIIPCHRVLGSNGDLTGYGGGIERKKWLLDFEAKKK